MLCNRRDYVSPREYRKGAQLPRERARFLYQKLPFSDSGVRFLVMPYLFWSLICKAPEDCEEAKNGILHCAATEYSIPAVTGIGGNFADALQHMQDIGSL